MTPSDALKEKIDILPESPGVYMYLNKDGKIIYVGKAKKLRRRVRSYFNREHTVTRTKVLVRNIADLRYIVVNTEEDALHLENSLIKENQPRYNVLLKDDKSYPWICVSNEPYPRVFITRDIDRKYGKYYGPYTSVQLVKTVLSLIREIYPIRTCRLMIDAESVEKNRHRVCLQYHIKRCEGCCEGRVSFEKYAGYIEEIKQILNGNIEQLTGLLIEQMQELSMHLKFEEAEVLKQKYLLLEKYKAKTVIVSTQIHNVDVYSYVRDENVAYINYMHIRGGSIVKSITLEYRCKLEESDAEMLSTAISEIQTKFAPEAKQIIVPFLPDIEFEGKTFIIPQKGDKKKLLDVSEKNARQYRLDKLKHLEKLNPEQRTMRILTAIQKDFRLTELPRHIECFDNSNFQGNNAVAACVVFKDGKPSKKDYRHFNIRTVVGPDDYASMREILTRRYSRLLAEGEPLPQLVVVDGGKGQLSAAVEVFDKLGLRGKIALCGLAERLEEIYFPGDSVPLYIDKDSVSLKVIMHLRDEAHRFGITHHRKMRNKTLIVSALDEIKGVGEVTRVALMRHFRSLKKVKEATEAEIADVVGPAKAKIIREALDADILETKD